MKRLFWNIGTVICLIGCICINASAASADSFDKNSQARENLQRATVSFDVDIDPYTRAKGETSFPMEAGEMIRIYGTYSPADSSVDFGLVDSDGIFHYVSAEEGIIDETFEIPERGEYWLGVENNSGKTVSISGFVRY